MRTSKLLIFGAFISTLLTGCFREREGDIVTENRSFNGTFEKIRVDGSMEVVVNNDPTYDIKVNAGMNVLAHLVTEIKNNELRIYMKNNHVRNRHGIKVWVNANQIKKAQMDGSGNIEIHETTVADLELKMNGSGRIWANVNVTNLNSDMDGSGSIEVDGSIVNHNCSMNGSGHISSENVEAVSVNANVNGSGHIKCYTNTSLDAVVNGSGNISYRGNPSNLNTKIIGSGSIRKIN